MKRKHYYLFGISAVVFMYIFLFDDGIFIMKNMIGMKDSRITVAIDAGHGGFDPGKVGINGALEKDINLSIAFKLKDYLEKSGIHVIMTRTEDKGLHDPWDRDKKRGDMWKRVTIINSSNALLAVSIHQNSYSRQSARGAQTFYFHKSEQGKILAEILLDRIKESMGDLSSRLPKSNSSYYMIRKTSCPLVIVECGFLSNWQDATLLCKDSYQDKIAEAISVGITEYIDLNMKQSTGSR